MFAAKQVTRIVYACFPKKAKSLAKFIHTPSPALPTGKNLQASRDLCLELTCYNKLNIVVTRGNVLPVFRVHQIITLIKLSRGARHDPTVRNFIECCKFGSKGGASNAVFLNLLQYVTLPSSSKAFISIKFDVFEGKGEILVTL